MQPLAIGVPLTRKNRPGGHNHAAHRRPAGCAGVTSMPPVGRPPGRGERCEYDRGTQIMVGRTIEAATACYQAQCRIVARAVNDFSREPGFEVLADAGDPENSRYPVSQPDHDPVPGAQRAEPVKDGRALVAVDVTFDDRGPDLARVGEYLYHAARPTRAVSDGTAIAPSASLPRWSSLESTPMAGISTDTGADRRSQGPRAPGPTAPAADWPGCGACCWAAIATPTAMTPTTMNTTPARPASRARMRPGGLALTSGANRLCGHDLTTENPATRRHSACANAPPLAACLPYALLIA